MKIRGPAEVEFKAGLNFLIGPNGSGKSMLLRALHECNRCFVEYRDSRRVHYFNAETMNPHAPDGPPGDMRNMILRTRGMFSSHGEIMKAALTTVPLRRGETLLVDEPETGQDAAGVKRIREGFDAIVKAGGQVIAASHHPLMLRGGHTIELEPGYVERIRAEYRRELCEKTPRKSASS